MNVQPNEASKHTLTLSARSHIEIGGVTDVVSFDEETVTLVTDCGELTVEGTSLHIGTLNIERGCVVIDGRVSALVYTDAATRKGKKTRLFG